MEFLWIYWMNIQECNLLWHSLFVRYKEYSINYFYDMHMKGRVGTQGPGASDDFRIICFKKRSSQWEICGRVIYRILLGSNLRYVLVTVALQILHVKLLYVCTPQKDSNASEISGSRQIHTNNINYTNTLFDIASSCFFNSANNEPISQLQVPVGAVWPIKDNDMDKEAMYSIEQN